MRLGLAILGLLALLAYPAFRAVRAEPASEAAPAPRVEVAPSQHAPVCRQPANPSAALRRRLERLTTGLAQQPPPLDPGDVVVLNGRGYNYPASSPPGDLQPASLDPRPQR